MKAGVIDQVQLLLVAIDSTAQPAAMELMCEVSVVDGVIPAHHAPQILANACGIKEQRRGIVTRDVLVCCLRTLRSTSPLSLAHHVRGHRN